MLFIDALVWIATKGRYSSIRHAAKRAIVPVTEKVMVSTPFGSLSPQSPGGGFVVGVMISSIASRREQLPDVPGKSSSVLTVTVLALAEPARMTQKSHTKPVAMGCTALLRRGAPMINRL